MYFAIDLIYNQFYTKEYPNDINFIGANVECLPFKNESFDLVRSLCLLHHVDDVVKTLNEIYRVTKPGGTIRITVPTDPGILNHLIKKFVTYPRMRKFGIKNPEYMYAIDHRNHAWEILKIIQHQFAGSASVKILFFPFIFKSINFNLLFRVEMTK